MQTYVKFMKVEFIIALKLFLHQLLFFVKMSLFIFTYLYMLNYQVVCKIVDI